MACKLYDVHAPASLLDHLLAEPGLNLIGCCNELNAGYAADVYAPSRGVGTCVVTFTVGGLSVLNAIAGAYSENLPIICIVGGPNSDYALQEKGALATLFEAFTDAYKRR
ncbi:pyruvate decarboxylase 1-like [Phoenix dactylifera]|uniref:pyruvate decarboxylase n=1 Tax=Phoenix dactylifera TaxID=42345 RepID=A0A8B9APM2_PHODC|nr:pyruvate decarboxylase 1-like [Phoenix dactylifera]